MTGAQIRVAETLLRATGGRSVLLRMPLPAVAGDEGEQVGLSTPQFQDVELGPVTFRRGVGTPGADGLEYELLVSAAAVAGLVGSLQYDSASVLFHDALGLLVDGDLLRIEAAMTMQNGGVAYLYQLRLRGALAQLS